MEHDADHIGIILGKISKKGGTSDSEDMPSGDEMKETIAEDVLSAVDKKDAKALMSALGAFFDACGMESDEATESKEG